MLRTLFAASVLLLAPAALLRADAPPKVQDKDLEGTWEVVTAVRDGKDDPPPGKATVTFEGDAMTAKLNDDVNKATFKADASKTPKTIDVTPADGPDKGKPMPGIYEVKGDEMRLCLPEPGKDRPTELSSKAGSGWMLITFKRVKK